MRKILALCSLLFTLPVLADPVVTLPAGAEFTLFGTTVRCLGAPLNPDAPKCSVQPYSGTTYSVFVGSNRWGFVDGFDNAVSTVMRLKESGLCN